MQKNWDFFASHKSYNCMSDLGICSGSLDRVREVAAMPGVSKTIRLSDICTLTVKKSGCRFDITGTSCSVGEVQTSLFDSLDLIYRSGGFINKK